ncbi:Putative phosphoribosyl transferase [Jeotgalibaca dankookensis]|uniref:Putative phosphoribosyl transferase n=1 Tax=Jeotgalibaca dankookensis TaxID=708126 RepID=A0A1S6INL7_9LACT|nr:phosphoribosyltransferase family protein [Jeotgalibaca dankookensis]AQS53153.1 Putative phosphoribosyl transferase [Jeotgalibaca dankookensis]
MEFKDRKEAGRLLAEKFTADSAEDIVVVALPRGGVPLGLEIAKHLQAPLDLVITRKIGSPQNPEYAIGSLAENSEPLLNRRETRYLNKDWLEAAISKARNEIIRRQTLYFENHQRQTFTGKTVILVDDGIATGFTVLAAIDEIKQQNPKKLFLAVPVLPKEMVTLLSEKVDELVVLTIPDYYRGSVGAYYEAFPQLTDDEVKQLLAESR